MDQQVFYGYNPMPGASELYQHNLIGGIFQVPQNSNTFGHYQQIASPNIITQQAIEVQNPVQYRSDEWHTLLQIGLEYTEPYQADSSPDANEMTRQLEEDLRQDNLNMPEEQLDPPDNALKELQNTLGQPVQSCLDDFWNNPEELPNPAGSRNNAELSDEGFNALQNYINRDSISSISPVPAEEPRNIICLHCHTNWWDDTCDNGQPCQNCAGRDCVRLRCPDDATGHCKKGNRCRMVHRSDTYYKEPYLIHVQKMPKRAVTKAKAKPAPIVEAQRRREALGLS